jgi:membrane associated rhomboid family serine protease
MRSDTALIARAAEEREKECGIVTICDSADPNAGFGCCVVAIGRRGMTSKPDCDEYGGVWASHTICDEAFFVYLRPCCGTNLNGQCFITTKLACAFLAGDWIVTEQLCSNVLCLKDTCRVRRIGNDISADKTRLNEPDSPNQFFRFFFPLFLHAGVLQLIPIVIVQVYAGRQVETQAGFVRTFLIYFISGIGGYGLAGIFSPDELTTGADPAVYGLLGVLLVELFQSWQIVPMPWLELLKLGGVCVVMHLLGTLPFLDNWSHVGGFVFGVVAGIAFLPYITFGKWDKRRKQFLVILSVPLLVMMFLLVFIAFYVVQNTDFCSWCGYVNCVPYRNDLCS